jgi:hypothetical protein|tara:strand:- start:441 stop:668 length:228 start_codon:yes stop_codon:yes gene_type:complete
MAQKTEIDSYGKLFYWLDSMIMKYSGTDKAVGIRRLRDFIESQRAQGKSWEDVAEWAIYSTNQTSGFDPFDQTQV